MQGLKKAHADGRLDFFNDHQALADRATFNAYLKPLYKTNWAVFAKEPFAGPKAVLAYLSRYTHRVAISNRRLISADDRTVPFKWKDYRAGGADRYKTMTLDVDEFIRRFLIHVFPKRFHRIRHYGLLANGNRAENVKRARQLLSVPENDLSPNVANDKTGDDETKPSEPACPACGGRMRIIEIFEPGTTPTHRHQRAPPNVPCRPS